MELIHIFLFFSVDFLSVMLVTGKPYPPKDVRINVIGSTAKISWTIPTNTQGPTWSRIQINTSTGGDIVLDSRNKTHKDIPVPESTFMINNLKMCSEYIVRIKFLIAESEFTSKKFWMTNTTSTFTADFNEDVALLWSTSLTDFFDIKSPLSVVIYELQAGDIIENGKTKKYIVNNKTNDTQAINITVLRVNETDAGLYRLEDTNRNVNGCCFLVVTSKPTKPTLIFRPEHPFVGDNITFTCSSTVQRWPEGYGTSHLSYQFVGNPRGDNDTDKLIIRKLDKTDKGRNISCQATDDLGKVSYKSNAVTIDPYYGPDDVILHPANKTINLTEGSNFGPINCSANCNPECIYKWKYKATRSFGSIHSNQSLTFLNIRRNQSGVYRCRVCHSANSTKCQRIDIAVNVRSSQTESCRAVTGMLATGLATLFVGLVAFVAATVLWIRNRFKYKKSKPNESEGYIEVQRSNPVFTEPYSTLQSQPESGPLQEPSTDTYDVCGVAPDVDT